MRGRRILAVVALAALASPVPSCVTTAVPHPVSTRRDQRARQMAHARQRGRSR